MIILFNIPILLFFTDQQINGATGGPEPSAQDPVNTEVDGATADNVLPTDQDKVFTLCLLHGGMDTAGEVFDDVLVINFDS